MICTLNDPRAAEIGRRSGQTRSAAAVELWDERLAGAVVAIGNAPTALFRLLELLDEGVAEAGIDHRPARRLHRRRRIEGGAGRKPARLQVHHLAGTPRRQRARRGRRQRAGKPQGPGTSKAAQPWLEIVGIGEDGLRRTFGRRPGAGRERRGHHRRRPASQAFGRGQGRARRLAVAVRRDDRQNSVVSRPACRRARDRRSTLVFGRRPHR